MGGKSDVDTSHYFPMNIFIDIIVEGRNELCHSVNDNLFTFWVNGRIVQVIPDLVIPQFTPAYS